MSKHTARVMVAVSEQNYRRCLDYIEAKGEAVPTMTYPTVYLEDEEGKVCGVMATHPSNQGLVVCGKASADSGFRLIQLVDAYELILARCGVQGYIIPLDKRATALKQLIERCFIIEPWGEDDTHLWYTRQIPHAVSGPQVLHS